jgi:UDP-MurNAc hydroxylase
MKIKLVSHASVLIETADTTILVDPWLFGKAFNDSWALLFDPVLSDEDLKKVEYVWISHEHPDHLHFASLKSLQGRIPETATVLFQEIPPKNVVNALRNIAGFKNIIELPHRKKVKLTEKTEVYCYHSRQLDSALAIMSDGESVLDINDVEISDKDRSILAKDLGTVDCVLNQFSVAGYSGDIKYGELIPAANQRIISNMIADSKELEAKVTIPFASFVYFCCEDNKYINPYANTPEAVLQGFNAEGLEMKLLEPGEEYSLGDPIDNDVANAFYEKTYSNIAELPIDACELVPLEKIQKAFAARCKQLHRNYASFFLKLINPITIRLPDLNQVVRITISTSEFEILEPDADFDLEIYSQPAWYGFKFPWGIQTLGVSGRLQLYKNAKHWRRVRYLMAMNNAGVHMRLKYLLSPDFAYFLRERGVGLYSQLIHRLRRAESGT